MHYGPCIVLVSLNVNFVIWNFSKHKYWILYGELSINCKIGIISRPYIALLLHCFNLNKNNERNSLHYYRNMKSLMATILVQQVCMVTLPLKDEELQKWLENLMPIMERWHGMDDLTIAMYTKYSNRTVTNACYHPCTNILQILPVAMELIRWILFDFYHHYILLVACSDGEGANIRIRRTLGSCIIGKCSCHNWVQ